VSMAIAESRCSIAIDRNGQTPIDFSLSILNRRLDAAAAAAVVAAAIRIASLADCFEVRTSIYVCRIYTD